MNSAGNEATRQAWRELDFYYDREDRQKSWRIVGTAAGLRKFAALLSAYAANPSHDGLSEHEHFGPYLYLEIGTWSRPEITAHWIAGPRSHLAALACLVEQRVAQLEVGERISLRTSFAPASPYDLVLERRGEGFDPAEEDPQCW